MKDSFILHLDQYAPIQGLSLEQKGMLLDALFRFNIGEAVSFDDPVVGMAFAFFKVSFERNKEVQRRLERRTALSSSLRAEIFKRDGYICQYCGSSKGPFECDHIFPVSRGGRNGSENLTTSCRSCNRSKGAKTLKEWSQ